MVRVRVMVMVRIRIRVRVRIPPTHESRSRRRAYRLDVVIVQSDTRMRDVIYIRGRDLRRPDRKAKTFSVVEIEVRFLEPMKTDVIEAQVI